MKQDEVKPESEPIPMIGRLKRWTDTGSGSDGGDYDEDSTMCDYVYVDRLTGREVLRYDAADPANRPPLGPSDEDILGGKGYSLTEEIEVSKSVVKVEPHEVSAWMARKAMKIEREEEIQRGVDLLADTNLWSYLGLDATEFSFSDYERDEQAVLKPALERKGFTLVSFFMGEQDSFGPLSRGIRGRKDGVGYIFYYG